MAKQGASKIVPRLRFPEFQKTSGWNAKILGGEGDFLSPLTGKTARHFGAGTAKYVTYMNVFANTFTDMAALGVVDVGGDESQNAIEAGDVLFTVSSETPEEVGMSSVVIDAVPNCYVNSFCAMFRFTDGGQPNLRFLGYSLRQPFSRRHFVKRAQGSTRFNLSKAAFRSLPLALPSPSEQQKIADCLTSLDEVIAAQGRKVETLKAYKRGLMQQLFPREGEIGPRHRFPKFRDAPEWEQKAGGVLFENRKEGGEEGLPIYSVTVNDGMIPRASFDRDFYDIEDPAKNKKAYKGDIAYNMMRMWQGAQGVAVEDCMVSPAYVVLSPLEGVCSGFFAYLFKLPQSLELLTAYSRGLTKDRLRLYFDDFARMPLCVPGYEEQQRIADCLSSFDNQIAAESTQFAALKTHKQGLMQQLFPAPETTSA